MPPVAVREQILLAVKEALEAVLDVSGAALKVYFGDLPPTEVDEQQAVAIRDLGDNPTRRHVRLAYENTLNLRIRIVVRRGEMLPALNDLHTVEARVHAALVADETWGGLAVGTELGPLQNDTDELSIGVGNFFREVQILYRVRRTDPFEVREI